MKVIQNIFSQGSKPSAGLHEEEPKRMRTFISPTPCSKGFSLNERGQIFLNSQRASKRIPLVSVLLSESCQSGFQILSG